ncbi:MAG: ATP-binding protein [Thermomicrobiales bacterium]
MRLIRPFDSIEIQSLPVLIYGPPGIGKTSLLQTADSPFTLDFDGGIHRSANRRDAMQFDSWSEVLKVGEEGYHQDGEELVGPMFDPFKTLGIDTGGMALEKLIPEVLRDSAKNGYSGNLSPQGWGVLGSRFVNWMRTVRSWGKSVVMVCHQAEDRNASDQAYFRPEFPGKMAYSYVHKSFDMIGRIYQEGHKKILDFSPRENQVGKNAAGFPPVEIPDLHKNPTFLADLIVKAKLAIGKTAEASAATSKAVGQWIQFLATMPEPNELNDELRGLAQLPTGAKVQVWALIKSHAEKRGFIWDKDAKRFSSQQTEEVQAEEGVPA